jgi:nitrogen fixation NifU-like protein
MYSAQVLDHFQNPRNAGDVENPGASAQVENPACGDVLKLTVRVVEGRITEIGFRAKGCVPSTACGSAITELVKGKTLAEVRSIRREQLVEAVGGLPQASEHASYLAMDTLAAVIKQLPS